MAWKSALLLLGVPVVEVWLLLSLPWPLELTLLEVAGTAVAGWVFSRREELSLWSELVSDLRNGRAPSPEALDAMLVVLGGWALMLPGLVSDLLGVVLLLAPVREQALPPLRAFLKARYQPGP